MMKLSIATITEEGQTILLDAHKKWVKEVVHRAFPRENADADSLKGKVMISRHEDNLTLSGTVSLTLNPLCDRCGESFIYRLKMSLMLHLVPEFDSARESLAASVDLEENESTLSEEDLNFAFYHGPEIDLAEILREQLVFALPPRFLCNENCQGLCPRCGANLNRGACGCPAEKEIDPRWEALKKIQNSKFKGQK